MLERAKSSIYRTGIFSLAGGGNFAFSKREFPVALNSTVFKTVQLPHKSTESVSAMGHELTAAQRSSRNR